MGDEDDDPFADLADSEAHHEQEEDATDQTATINRTEGTTSMSQSSQQPEQSTEKEGLTEPAFSFDGTEQDAFYARPEAWQQFEDFLDLDLEMELRDRGVRNASKSEKHDAVLRVIAEHADEVADQIEAERKL